MAKLTKYVGVPTPPIPPAKQVNAPAAANSSWSADDVALARKSGPIKPKGPVATDAGIRTSSRFDYVNEVATGKAQERARARKLKVNDRTTRAW